MNNVELLYAFDLRGERNPFWLSLTRSFQRTTTTSTLSYIPTSNLSLSLSLSLPFSLVTPTPNKKKTNFLHHQIIFSLEGKLDLKLSFGMSLSSPPSPPPSSTFQFSQAASCPTVQRLIEHRPVSSRTFTTTTIVSVHA